MDTAAESPDGERPYGAAFDDLAAFLQRPVAGGYTVDVVPECVCRSCGGKAFEVGVPVNGHAARRTCLGCHGQHYIADSADYWEDDGEADYFCGCPCGNEEFAECSATTLTGRSAMGPVSTSSTWRNRSGTGKRRVRTHRHPRS